METIENKMYRAMIYVAHSTMVFYDLETICDKTYTVEKFRVENPELIKRVFQEAINIFNYELSHEQINKAIHCFLVAKYNPCAISKSIAYNPNHNYPLP